VIPKCVLKENLKVDRWLLTVERWLLTVDG
jgi:hypothetical protein